MFAILPRRVLSLLGPPGVLFSVIGLFFVLSLELTAAEGQTQAPVGTAPQEQVSGSQGPTAEWKGNVGGGLQLESGRTNGRGFMFTGDVERDIPGRQSISFDGQLNHSTFQAGTAPRAYAAHNMIFSGQWVRTLNKRFFVANRFSFSRDLLLGIKERRLNASGIGINLLFSKKGQLHIVPAFGYGAQSTSISTINGAALGFSAYQKFEYQLTKTWGVRQWFQVRTNKEHIADKSMRGHIELNAPAIHKRLFLSFSVDYTYEGVLSVQAINEGATRNDVVSSVKLNYRIGR